MNLLRLLVLPTAIATPLWLWVLPVPYRGTRALSDFNFGLADLIFGVVFTLLGLLLIGLPVASLVARQRFPAYIKAALLLVAGVLGGALVAIFYVVMLAVLGGGLSSDMAMDTLELSIFGFLPGLVVAVVWIAINFNKLEQPTRGARHG